MLHFSRKWGVLLAILLIFITCGLSSSSTQITEARNIRKLYLDFLHYPPTPTEIDWFLIYQSKTPYETAVNWVCLKLNNDDLKPYMLSSEYKTSTCKLTDKDIERIIQYQCGNPTKNVDLVFVELAIKAGEGDCLASIDYMALCLMARVTSTTEANYCLNLYKSYNSPTEGLLAVLNALKQYNDVIYK